MKVSRFRSVSAYALGLLVAIGQLSGHALAKEWLTATEIETGLGGKTLEGMYATGQRFTERYLPGGQLEYVEGGQLMTGHWSVKAGTLCTIYDTDPTGGCYRVSRSGPNCYEFYFASRSEEAAPGPLGVKPDWTARGAVDGQIDACKEGAHV
jgi:hypothetical protein